MQAELFEEFAEQLITEKGIQVGDDNLSDELKAQMVKSLSVRVRNYVLSRLLKSLDNKELTELEVATDEDNEEKAKAVLDGKQVEIARALAAFKTRYIGVV